MAVKTRTDLKGLFSNGKKLNQEQFYDLIDSMLNKRDDFFMGRWRPGTVYRTGNVVIYNQALWEVPPDEDGNPQEICSCHPPGESDDWVSLIVPVEDEDWVVHKINNAPNGVMHARHYQCVGIGRVWDSTQTPPDVPEAKLEIVDGDGIEETPAGRFLIFPKEAENPTLSLLQVGDDEERMNAFFLLGLDNNEAHFNTDAPAGFIFRRQGHAVPGMESHLNILDGDVLMVIEPAEAGSGNARVGISTKDPCAMLDVTDRSKGQFLLSPEDKDDPVFTILNLDPNCDKNYLASGVGTDWSVFITDAPNGFAFKCGPDYGSFCRVPDINQGHAILVIQCNNEDDPQVGIGTDAPCAMLHVTDGQKGAFLVNPERAADPVFTLVKLDPASDKNYLAGTAGAQRASFATNAPNGFEFKTGPDIAGDCPMPELETGERLVVMLPDGKVGIGTKSYDPTVRVEVTDERSGKILFNLDDKKVNPAIGIVNTRPGTDTNYFALGADNQTAVLVTDSKNGFSFKQGGPAGVNDNEVDVVQGDIYLRLLPQRPGPPYKPAEAVFFPDIKGKVSIMRTPGDFQLDVRGQVRAYNFLHDTDATNLSHELPLNQYLTAKGYGTALEKVMELAPIAFDWDNQATNLGDEGKQFGLRAQDVQDVLADLVKENSTDLKLSVAYAGVLTLLVQAIKEQQAEIEGLKTRVTALGG
jgi:hypothetical protein